VVVSPSPLILAFGDSLIAGYGLSSNESFPAQLEDRLRAGHPGVRVVNAGEAGDTTGDALRRLPRVLTGLADRPRLAIVQLGPNDVLRQVGPARTKAQLGAILTEFGRCDIPVLLATVEPPAFLRDRASGYLNIHEDLAAQHGAAICPFFPPGVLGRADMVLWDRVHPSARAIATVVESMLPTVERLLGGR
jgi:acyl-CoA thioesterase-1